MDIKVKKIIAALSFFLAATPVLADRYNTYEVSITNGTTHQVLTPPLLTTHNKHFSLFNVGGVASDGLVTLAETGNPSDLHQEVVNARGVQDVVVAGGPILYGESASFHIKGSKRGRISISTMLATTNDAFAAINSMPLPKKSATYLAYVYDAGSEMNNEDCDFIPGPPCNTSGNARTPNGEGFISFHNGVQGGSDLNPKKLDWRGPVAVITITKVDD